MLSFLDSGHLVVRELDGKCRQVLLPRPAAPKLEPWCPCRVEASASGHRAREARALDQPDRLRAIVVRPPVRVGEPPDAYPERPLDDLLGAVDLPPRALRFHPREDRVTDGVRADREAESPQGIHLAPRQH